MLKIEGLLFPLGKPSEHAIAHGDNAGRVVFYEKGISPLLGRLTGLGVFAPDFKTRIGSITRAWISDSAVHVEGDIKESPAARRYIAPGNCELCLEFAVRTPFWIPRFLEKHIQSGLPASFVVPSAVRICLPGKSGFPQSYVRFVPEARPVMSAGLIGMENW